MNGGSRSADFKKLSPAGLLATVGVSFGAIGTSPLYVMEIILNGAGDKTDQLLVYGSLSCIFWSLAILATFKYLILALQSDNRGEGGVFALFALLKRKSGQAGLFVIAAGSALLGSSIIAQSITLTSSVEGFELVNPRFPVLIVILLIFLLFFFIQRYRPGFIGSSAGPVMTIWFLFAGVAGFSQIIQSPQVIAAINPLYAVKFLGQYPGGFVLLGALFLSTAGAESFYQELGTYGKTNIRVSWAFVKMMLLLSYFGQGAWILSHNSGSDSINPFFAIIPGWFILPGIVISVFAALFTCQSILNRSFTLVSEAISLNLWPNIKVIHPTLVKGQVYLPLINWLFWGASAMFVVIFRQSQEMGAAYGLLAVISMISTTGLLAFYYNSKNKGLYNWMITIAFLIIIEALFLAAIIFGLNSGGWFSLILISFFSLIMIGWYFGRKIKNRYITYANISDYTSLLTELHSDKSVPAIATNLVYSIKASKVDQVESKVIYSIFQRQPKRAQTYWFLHIDRVDDPDRFDYEFKPLIPGILHRIDFHLGFKVEPRINLYFREVLEDLVKSGEISLSSSYESMKKHNITGDFKYIVIDRVMLRDNKLSALENFLLTLHGYTRWLDITDERSLHLDLTNTIVEKIPIVLAQPADLRITRIR